MADGCASGKSQRKQNSRKQRSITDELFKELDQTESEDKQGITPKELDQPVVKKIQGWTAEKLNKVEGKQRPPWALSKNLGTNALTPSFICPGPSPEGAKSNHSLCLFPGISADTSLGSIL